jgi:hypothetical protein
MSCALKIASRPRLFGMPLSLASRPADVFGTVQGDGEDVSVLLDDDGRLGHSGLLYERCSGGPPEILRLAGASPFRARGASARKPAMAVARAQKG